MEERVLVFKKHQILDYWFEYTVKILKDYGFDILFSKQKKNIILGDVELIFKTEKEYSEYEIGRRNLKVYLFCMDNYLKDSFLRAIIKIMRGEENVIF